MKNLNFIFILLLAIYPNLKGIGQCTPVPINDSPCMNDVNPPYDLGYGGAFSGTTCCAIGYNDNPNADKANVECGTVTDDDAVWFRVTVNPDYEGIMLSLYDEYGTTIGYEHSVEVYGGGENAICDGTAELVRTYCVGEYVSESHIGCFEDVEYLFIKVSTSESDCGTFSIYVDQDNIWGAADDCKSITEEETLYPESRLDEEECLTDYLVPDICPSTGLNACEIFETNATTWFKIIADDDANILNTSVITGGDWTPVWAVFSGDCDNLEVLESADGFTCSLDSGPNSSTMQYNILEGVYYVAVSSLEGGSDYKYFEICASTKKKTVLCLGEENYCDNDESTSFTIIKRENSQFEPNGPPYNGPFCPGEQLTLEVEFTYDVSNTDDERLLAMIPDFGKGWDIDYYNLFANPPVAGTNIEAEWFDEDSKCYPYVTETFDNLCVYLDDNSKLHICNTLCEDCPCNEGMKEGDQIPSGYFWANESNENGCSSSDCSPSTKRGISGTDGEIVVSWTIKMKVKEYLDSTCAENTDLSVSFMTFSDGVAGCHSDKKAECLLDRPQHSPDWEINCENKNNIAITPINKNICSGGSIGILVKSIEDTTKTILISYDDNSFVKGEKKDTFYHGLGLIKDTLTLINEEVCDSQVVYYYAKFMDNAMLCPIKTDTIKVYVYPKPVLKINKTDETSYQANNGSARALLKCMKNSYTFNWSRGDTTSLVRNLAPGKYFLTVTDQNGCDKVDSVIIEPYICKDMSITYQKNDVLCYGDCTAVINIDDIINGISPFEYQWNTGDKGASIENLCAGSYIVTITDSVNCVFVDTIIVYSPDELMANISSTDETSLNSNDGTATVNPSGGKEPYSIEWSNGETNSSISNLAPGTYYVTVTDLFGCIDEDSIYVQPFECGTLNIVSEQNNVTCFGNCDGNIDITKVENSNGFLKFSWSNGETTAKAGNLCAGDYSVTITDSLGCSISQSFTITQPADITITVDSVKNIGDNSLGAIFVSTNGNYTYNWTGPKGNEGNSKNLTGIDSAGCYTLLVTDTTTDCTKDTTICVERTTGIFNQIQSNEISLYPNPTSGLFYIEINGFNAPKAEISILDISGKEVYATGLTLNKKVNSIDVKKLRKALYFVKIKIARTIVFKKLIIGL